MFVKEYNNVLSLHEEVFENYEMDKICYFDIETTGFDKKEDSIILISFGRFKNREKFFVKQYFAEKLEDEEEILSDFAKDMIGCRKWCSYNGKAFDEPFIESRMIKYNILFQIPKEHIDLYRIIRPYYKQLGMERCNLKSVEKHIGIERRDKIDGGICVDLYNEFLLNYDKKLKETIMLHNYEDVVNLPKIHEFIFKVENNHDLVRKDVITKNQLKCLENILKKNNIVLNVELDKISRKAAARVIDNILKGCLEITKLKNIISNSY